ncbi:hypothetical protein ATCC33389_0210820 [Aggregatibacter aphrophilus ATCC 33389]|nr:hypothetical protein ATCC33389_0210820 [Aggregatibacter aphrophilus ATCC 33389]
MGLPICLFAVCSFGAVISFMHDKTDIAILFLIVAVCLIGIMFTVISVSFDVVTDCQDYGKFKIGVNFYRCELIQGQ